jgi:hypothetical protein
VLVQGMVDVAESSRLAVRCWWMIYGVVETVAAHAI